MALAELEASWRVADRFAYRTPFLTVIVPGGDLCKARATIVKDKSASAMRAMSGATDAIEKAYQPAHNFYYTVVRQHTPTFFELSYMVR